jgi:hypothetical protein
MAAAQTLYGVTMQEPGVSKLVSVRMADHGRPTSGVGAQTSSAAPALVGA